QRFADLRGIIGCVGTCTAATLEIHQRARSFRGCVGRGVVERGLVVGDVEKGDAGRGDAAVAVVDPFDLVGRDFEVHDVGQQIDGHSANVAAEWRIDEVVEERNDFSHVELDVFVAAEAFGGIPDDGQRGGQGG